MKIKKYPSLVFLGLIASLTLLPLHRAEPQTSDEDSSSGTSSRASEVKIRGPRNVLTYYLAMPGFYLGWGEESGSWYGEDDRIQFISVKDIQNGYLKITPKLTEGWAEISVFKDRNKKRDIVAVTVNGCAPACRTLEYHFLLFEDNVCLEITSEIFPRMPREVTSKPYLMNLPRLGTAIKIYSVINENQKTELPFEIRWSQGKFHLINLK